MFTVGGSDATGIGVGEGSGEEVWAGVPGRVATGVRDSRAGVSTRGGVGVTRARGETNGCEAIQAAAPSTPSIARRLDIPTTLQARPISTT